MRRMVGSLALGLLVALTSGCASELEMRDATRQAAAEVTPVLTETMSSTNAIPNPPTSPPATTAVIPPADTDVEPATSTPAPVDPALAAALGAVMQGYVDTGRFMGAVLVAQGGQVVFSTGYGAANLETGAPNSPQTQFRSGSLTKQFTAAAVLQLQEQGQLSLQDPLARYLPDFPGGENITLHHLLNHTSGVADHTMFPGFRDTLATPHPPEALIATFAGAPPDFAPGSRFAYSNSNYVLLGRVIEVVSGQPYATYMQEHIFNPLGMAQSGYGANVPPAGAALGYTSGLNGLQPVTYVDMSIPYAAGAVVTSVEDLNRWDRALRGSALLSPESLALMFTPNQGNYGYGWFIEQGPTGRVASHAGSIFGYRSFIRRGLDDDFLVVVLSNLDGAPVPDIAAALENALE